MWVRAGTTAACPAMYSLAPHPSPPWSVSLPLLTERIVAPGNCRHPVSPPGATEYDPDTRALPGWITTVALSTACARVTSLNLTSPVGGVAKATAMERAVAKTTTVATIEVLRMVVPPDYEMQCCGLRH